MYTEVGLRKKKIKIFYTLKYMLKFSVEQVLLTQALRTTSLLSSREINLVKN
jgi:hypothetical protein